MVRSPLTGAAILVNYIECSCRATAANPIPASKGDGRDVREFGSGQRPSCPHLPSARMRP
jgi:hypothetical protein